MSITLCFVKEEYFEENNNYIKLLDPGHVEKQSKRTHICIKIEKNTNTFLIPLRNNLGDDLRKYGRIGHSIPSIKRKNAGLDYRYTLVINDEKYLELQNEKRIPESQYRKLKNEYHIIETEFETYLNGYIKAAKKKRNEKEPLFRESSLINFHKELGIQP